MRERQIARGKDTAKENRERKRKRQRRRRSGGVGTCWISWEAETKSERQRPFRDRNKKIEE